MVDNANVIAEPTFFDRTAFFIEDLTVSKYNKPQCALTGVHAETLAQAPVSDIVEAWWETILKENR